MSHSKRNTAGALFTAHERSQLRQRWGSQTSHLTRDSFLAFGSCRLCLLPARDPVSCAQQGHLFCRECAIANLLAQKTEAQRKDKEVERRTEDEAARKEVEEAEKMERERVAFELLSTGTGGARKRGAEWEVVGTEADWAGAKRARKDGGDGRVSASFWVPGVAASEEVGMEERKKVSKHAVCPGSEEGKTHVLSLKTLVDVRFEEEKGGEGNGPRRVCPACNKTLSNATRAVMVTPCGHVVCKACADKFLVPPETDPHDPSQKGDEVARCYVCSAPVAESKKGEEKEKDKDKKKSKDKARIKPGIVEISCEGTGFAGGGKNQVTKAGVSYQC